ncbi:unnamed protein product [Lactuca virosa]|uniref:Uncharacterized protein n=1 Tax=Lactuca virosa TaxID=75947 RepID=A0AAU9P7E6_9ASTR|nr:unnamed protein product [Lactuca virosa]
MFNEYLESLASSQFTIEEEVEFKFIMYMPAITPMGNERHRRSKKSLNITLYVIRVFISYDFDGKLFPRYLSFVTGVADSNYLPLNVSREILQESHVVLSF